jgi:hypothetical protein
MKKHAHTPSPCVARAIAIIGVAILGVVACVASAHTAQAGINVWTSHGPRLKLPVLAVAIDPFTPSTLYAGTDDGGVYRSTDGGGSWTGLGAVAGGAAITALAIPEHALRRDLCRRLPQRRRR